MNSDLKTYVLHEHIVLQYFLVKGEGSQKTLACSNLLAVHRRSMRKMLMRGVNPPHAFRILYGFQIRQVDSYSFSITPS